MNRQKSIAVFAAIAAIAMTTIGLTGVSAESLMISSIPQTQEGVGILGHVEYTKMNSDGQIIGYFQSDNTVVDAGKDCVANLIFGADLTGSNCGITGGDFIYVAIGNSTAGVGVTHSPLVQLDSSGTSLCALTGGDAQDGEMARKLVVPTITTFADDVASQGTVVELETADPFTFTQAPLTNVTFVKQSGIFNAQHLNGDIECTTATTGPGAAATNWDMFSIQELSGATGIQVTDGDSLSVKWTITIG